MFLASSIFEHACDVLYPFAIDDILGCVQF
jgi:hypothetical protein